MQTAMMVDVVQLVFICAAAEGSEEFLRLTKVLKFLHCCLMSILSFLGTSRSLSAFGPAAERLSRPSIRHGALPGRAV